MLHSHGTKTGKVIQNPLHIQDRRWNLHGWPSLFSSSMKWGQHGPRKLSWGLNNKENSVAPGTQHSSQLC
jgi:hypothetical protein